MKKLLFIASLIAAAYVLYPGGGGGAYSDDGAARTIFFTTGQCGRACEQMRGFLKRRTAFEEHDAFDNGHGRDLYKSYGGTGYMPYIVMGKQRVTGYNPGEVISAIAIEFGPQEIKADERRALQRNFLHGEPRVVMYATDWCGYCKKAREYFAENGIDYIEFDVEKDQQARRDYDVLLGSGFPLIYHGYDRMSGFDRRRIEREFDL